MANKKKLIIIIIAFIILMPIGITFARYVVKNIKHYLAEANSFFFSSDKLIEDGEVYNISSWGGVNDLYIQFELNNHKNNILTSDSDIVYSLNVSCSPGISCTLDSTSGVIYKAEKTDNFLLTISPQRTLGEKETFEVDVSATSSSPYVKTLSAKFRITVGKKGVNYEIIDQRYQPYFNFNVTNSRDSYIVRNTFGTYNVGDEISADNYLALSSTDKKNCSSARITLSWDASNVILDTTSDIMKVSTKSTQNVSGVDYINSITFNVDATSSNTIRFYKFDKTENYTYPIITPTSVINFSVE